LANATDIIVTWSVTTTTADGGMAYISCLYSTPNSDDQIELWGSITVVPSAGSIDIIGASISAVKTI